jgi:hypothetical protein
MTERSESKTLIELGSKPLLDAVTFDGTIEQDMGEMPVRRRIWVAMLILTGRRVKWHSPITINLLAPASNSYVTQKTKM